jgi:CheY-like chemotaxis protein
MTFVRHVGLERDRHDQQGCLRDRWPQSCVPMGAPVENDPDHWTAALMPPAIASILVVDDDRDLCDLLDTLLTAEGYRVWCVYDGEAAWEAVQQTPPDLILSDIKMPKLDGVTLALRLAEAAFGIPVILMSAGYDDWAGVASRFLRKPFEIDHLLASIGVLLTERELGCGTELR